MTSRTAATLGLTALLVLTVSLRVPARADGHARDLDPFFDTSGVVQTISTNGAFAPDNPFYQSLGTNGRTCATCHQASDGWSMTPAHIQARFDATRGTDPLFSLNDGATCSSDDVSSLAARRQAYRMLLTKGVIRVGIGIPAGAEFSLVDVDDPYTCASASELSLFRRPLPSTNLGFLSAVMWDGREATLRHQALDATLGHAQATVPPTDLELDQIVALESGLFTAQTVDRGAGRLAGRGAFGGPATLSQLPFFIGINDPIGLNPTDVAFDARAFTLFRSWLTDRRASDANRAIARGEEIFNSRPITITGVGGLNDTLGAPSIVGTCTTCHDTPNVGDHSVAMALNLGLSDESRRTPDMPLYTLRCTATGATVKTTDPGRALITGRCADIGKFKGPILRGLAARAPYFHNGSAATLTDVVNFYDERFGLRLTPQEKSDLVAFLRAL